LLPKEINRLAQRFSIILLPIDEYAGLIWLALPIAAKVERIVQRTGSRLPKPHEPGYFANGMAAFKSQLQLASRAYPSEPLWQSLPSL
jgi:hypothetical protein